MSLDLSQVDSRKALTNRVVPLVPRLKPIRGPLRTLGPITRTPSPLQLLLRRRRLLLRLPQEDRLKALEEGLHTLRVQGEERHNVLLKQQTDDRDAAKAQNEQLSDRIALLSHDFSRQLQQSVDSLQGAQAQQQKQVQTSIDELKQLLLAGREPATQSHAKKPRHEPQEPQDDL